jgi:hypothetical protein
MIRPLLAIALISLAACSTIPGSAPVASSTDWRQVVTSADRARLRDWRTAFTRALAQARAAGHAADLAREGKLLEPDAAIGPVPIPNGLYRCRVIKVGAKTPGLLDYVAYPAFACRVGQERELQGFNKLTGSQRPSGVIFLADPLRQVFLGTLVLGDERGAMQYGRDQDRDIAGWVERIGDRRWRMILPYPHYESTLDVIELVPEQ